MADPKVEQLISSYIHDSRCNPDILRPQFRHRIALVDAWKIPAGSKIVDVGCGQGDSTIALAQAVGPDGHVTGVDPGSLDYGGPITLGQAQSYIKASDLGSRVDFIQTDLVGLLSRGGDLPPIDAVVLCKSLWYFPDLESISQQFKALAQSQIPRIYVAEYSYHASHPDAEPNVLAARAQAALHATKRQEGLHAPNIRSAPDPETLKKLVAEQGWKVVKEGLVTPDKDLQDGRWECQLMRSNTFAKWLEEALTESGDDEKKKSLKEAVEKFHHAYEEREKAGTKSMRTMDIWWAVLEL
jgi:SAM-dependent methyltransferase